MTTMRAYRLLAYGKPAEFAEVEVPQPGPGEVLIKMASAGLCHSDIYVMDAEPGYWPDPPFTLGHENAGYVAARGAGADLFKEGDAVLVSSLHSCGWCESCLRGLDNYCWRPMSMCCRGVGEDGGLAEYMIAPQRHLMNVGSLPPAKAAPLTDAGGTSYHAVKAVLPKLVPGTTAVVIGIGGLGGYAVQYLKLLSAARVIAVDVSADRLAVASRYGADAVLQAGADTAQQIKDLTNGIGVTAVLDFVGSDDSLATALATAKPLGSICVCGMGGGTASVRWATLAPGCELFLSAGFTLPELREVVDLATAGTLQIDIDCHPFDEVEAAYQKLRTGDVQGRLVISID